MSEQKYLLIRTGHEDGDIVNLAHDFREPLTEREVFDAVAKHVDAYKTLKIEPDRLFYVPVEATPIQIDPSDPRVKRAHDHGLPMQGAGGTF